MIDEEILKRFEHLLAEAHHYRNSDCDPTAMTLATVDAQGCPSLRTVLLKQADTRGFVFFTNSRSRKGRQLDNNPNAALCFYWHCLNQQVEAAGTVEVIPASESDEYWKTRERDKQIAAWASNQSEPLENRDLLMQQIAHYKNKFEGERIPRPPHWYGYRLIPTRIEFWKAGWHRLHERICYQKTAGSWETVLLNP